MINLLKYSINFSKFHVTFYPKYNANPSCYEQWKNQLYIRNYKLKLSFPFLDQFYFLRNSVG